MAHKKELHGGKSYRSAIKPHHYVRIFELARTGAGKEQIAKLLAVSKQSFVHWLKTDEAALEAYNKGRLEHRTANLSDYVYKHLPDHLKPIWDELREAADDDSGMSVRRAMEGLSLPKRDRQHLFVHALVTSNFNAAEALRKTGIPWATWNNWKKEEDFRDLIKAVMEMKKDFVEGSLMGLISQGDTAAIIFANKTLNSDRGYNPKTTVEHTGTVDHNVITVDQILESLDVSEQRQLLAKIRQIKEGKKPLSLPPKAGQDEEQMLVEDAEYTIREKNAKELAMEQAEE